MVPQDQRVLRVLSRTERLAAARKLCARTSLQDDVAMDEAVVVAESFGTITGAPQSAPALPLRGSSHGGGLVGEDTIRRNRCWPTEPNRNGNMWSGPNVTDGCKTRIRTVIEHGAVKLFA
jgi:hypothetical protein